MPYRVAADVLEHLLPIDAGSDPETLRACTLKAGEELRSAAPVEPAVAASSITLTLNSTFIRRCEDGQTTDTELTAFTDGCSGLRSILVNAGVTDPPGLDWFHIAMRLQHAGKTASTLPADTPERENARAVIVAEVERLRWRIWNGRARDA